MDALRSVWPVDRDLMNAATRYSFGHALAELEAAYDELATVTENMLGQPITDVLKGYITTHEELDNLGVPR